MATAVIIDDYRNKESIPKTVDYPISAVKEIDKNIKIIDTTKNKITKIKTVNNPLTQIKYSTRSTVAISVLPYRVRFTAIGISGTGRIPGIGIQIIGVSNWIL